jgi:GH25 family lysozyme M1 (1,4-beta-N-acetylmuramidase)
MITQGIDVSNWQGAFDWPAWQGKISFAAAKATEGDADTDEEFARNWAGMWDLDRRMPRFAYHYFHASLDPVIQAVHLVATVRAHGLLPGDNFLWDLESTARDGLNDGQPPAVTAERAREGLRKVNELAPGHRVLTYMSPSFALTGHSEGLGAWHLWDADYGVLRPAVPEPWSQWTFWQHSETPVDLDVFNGSRDALLAFTRMPDKR